MITIEMDDMNGSTKRNNDPNAMLNECRAIGKGIAQLDKFADDMDQLCIDLEALISNDQIKAKSVEMQDLATQVRELFRTLVKRIKELKTDPASKKPRNEKQLANTENNLRQTYQRFVNTEKDCRDRARAQVQRQLRTVMPDATEEEIDRAVEDSANGRGVFQSTVSLSLLPWE
jgi:syntaxin 1B/2/3